MEHLACHYAVNDYLKCDFCWISYTFCVQTAGNHDVYRRSCIFIVSICQHVSSSGTAKRMYMKFCTGSVR
jgi:hypothetical protein